MTLIIGNIIALIASILMVYTGIIKQKKKILYIQSIQIFLLVISNLVLKGITGVIINIISFIRNVLCYKDKLYFKEKIIITILSVVLTLCFNNHGIIGILPLISAIIYLWFMTIEDVLKFKVLFIFTMILWVIYDFSIQLYTLGIFDIFTILTTIISIIKLKKVSPKLKK